MDVDEWVGAWELFLDLDVWRVVVTRECTSGGHRVWVWRR